MLNKMKAATLAALAMAFGAVATPALATGSTGPDFTTLTSVVSFDTAQDAVLSIGGLAIAFTVLIVGIRLIMATVRRAG